LYYLANKIIVQLGPNDFRGLGKCSVQGKHYILILSNDHFLQVCENLEVSSAAFNEKGPKAAGSRPKGERFCGRSPGTAASQSLVFLALFFSAFPTKALTSEKSVQSISLGSRSGASHPRFCSPICTACAAPTSQEPKRLGARRTALPSSLHRPEGSGPLAGEIPDFVV